MIEVLHGWDVAAFEFLNGIHSAWMDPIMATISARATWVPIYVMLAWAIFREKGWGDLVLVGLLLGLVVILADQIASGWIKPMVQRYRPCQVEAGLDFAVHVVEGKCGGKYGFVSSHAANFLAMATMLSFRFPHRPWPWIFFALAGITSYSRIYLGVHYPGDVLAGGSIGILMGWLGWCLYRWIQRKWLVTSGTLPATLPHDHTENGRTDSPPNP